MRQPSPISAARLRRFAEDTSGTMTVFALFFLIIFLLVGGMAIDFMRHEERRVRIQHTLDRAVLAAADLDQDITRRGQAKTIVMNYFRKAGLEGIVERSDIEADIRLNCRDVQLAIAPELPTFLLHMSGIDTLPVPASAHARECVSDVEVSLVLDVSGSMSENNRLPNLKVAAKEFVTELLDGTMDESGNITPNDATEEDRVSISIVPFATHVNVGASFGALLDGFTDEHAYSHCVRFSSGDYSETAIDPSDTVDDEGAVLSTATILQREGHFNPWTYRWKAKDLDGNWASMDAYDFVCQTGPDRYITPWSVDPVALAAHIDSFNANGMTSMEIGMKWGVALLDPAMQPALDAAGVDDDLSGRPFDYDRPETLKVIVIMSDGENTTQYDLNDEYMGLSPVHIDEDNPDWYSDDEYSVFHGEITDEQYPSVQHAIHGSYDDDDDYWWHEDRQGNDPFRDHPDEDRMDGGDPSIRVSYHDLFDRMSLAAWSAEIHREYHDEFGPRPDWDEGYLDAVTAVGPTTKDTRLSAICAAARAEGIVIFTIGFEAPAAGDAALLDCATSNAHFFDADGLEISEAFSAIESQINQLRLLQ